MTFYCDRVNTCNMVLQLVRNQSSRSKFPSLSLIFIDKLIAYNLVPVNVSKIGPNHRRLAFESSQTRMNIL